MTQQWSATFERELPARQALRVTYSGFHSTDLTMAPDLNQIAAEHHRLRQPAARGQAVPQLEPRQHARQRRLSGLPRRRRAVPRRPRVAGACRTTTTYKWAHSIDNIEDRGAGQADFQTRDQRPDRQPLRPRLPARPDDQHPDPSVREQPDLEPAVRPRTRVRLDDAGGARRGRRRLDAVDARAGPVRPAPDGVLQQPLRLRHQLLRQREGGRGGRTGSEQRSADARRSGSTPTRSRSRRSATRRDARSSPDASATPRRATSSAPARGTSTWRRSRTSGSARARPRGSTSSSPTCSTIRTGAGPTRT